MEVLLILLFRLEGSLSGESCQYVADIFFFSAILFFGSFLLCTALKRFKQTPFFPSWVRYSTPLLYKCRQDI
jgi:hypothetical protein